MIYQSRKNRSTRHKSERRVCVSRLRCTAGQILAVFLGSCRSAFARRLLRYTKHDRYHASTCAIPNWTLHMKMGYAAVQCVGLKMDNANGADHFRGSEHYLIFVNRTSSFHLLSLRDRTHYSCYYWHVYSLAMECTRLTRTLRQASEFRV
jgi:hypothetical protein